MQQPAAARILDAQLAQKIDAYWLGHWGTSYGQDMPEIRDWSWPDEEG